MYRIIVLSLFILIGSGAYAYYDFCQSPQDYNTFPPLYDVRTEYWKDIPNYNNKDKVHYNYSERDFSIIRPSLNQSLKDNKNADK